MSLLQSRSYWCTDELTFRSPVTCLELSLESSYILVGTHTGDILIHALPSHQHIRTISSHSGPITHLSALLRPPDLFGSSSKSDAWQLSEIKPFERMRARSTKDIQDVPILLRPTRTQARIDSVRAKRPQNLMMNHSDGSAQARDAEAELALENQRLRAALDRAVKINQHMWNGIVDMQLVKPVVNGGDHV